MKLGFWEKLIIIVGIMTICAVVAFNFYAFKTTRVEAAPVTVAPSVILDNIIDTLLISPPKIKVGNIAPGDTAESYLVLDNRYNQNLTVYLSISPPEYGTSDYDTGLTYSPAPENITDWISPLTEKVEIPALSTMTIPISFTIPKKAELPERWEFDIQVAQAQGFLLTALIQRWLITMR
jgi:hypothetical protein